MMELPHLPEQRAQTVLEQTKQNHPFSGKKNNRKRLLSPNGCVYCVTATAVRFGVLRQPHTSTITFLINHYVKQNRTNSLHFK